MFRALTFVFLIGLVIYSPAPAQQATLPSLGPTFEVPMLPACNAPCNDTAAVHRDIVAVSRTTPDVPSGEVVVFTRRDAQWSQTALLANPAPCLVPTPPPGQDPLPCWDPLFGRKLAVQGQYLFASAEPSSELEPRAIYVFKREGDAWRVRQRIEFPAPNVSGLEIFQIADVAASRDRLAVSTTFMASIDGEQQTVGAVYVLERGRDGRYRREAKLAPSDAYNAGFGSALAFRSDIIAIGASSANAVYVFERGKHHWRLKQKLAPSRPGAQGFGGALALSRGMLAVSAPGYYDAVNSRFGLVYLYRGDKRGVWHSTQVLDDPLLLESPGSNVRRFGSTLALQGRRLLVGVGQSDRFFDELPQTLLFEPSNGQWQPTAGLVPHEQPVATLLSGHTAVVVSTAFRWGHLVYMYDLPETAQ